MKRWALPYFILLGLCFIFLFIPFEPALVFYKENTSDVAAYLPVESGETFQITFTHSIHLTDVVETYSVTDDLKIKQEEIVFEHFGIGMPANAEEGQTFHYENGKYAVKNIDKIFPAMNIRNGKTVSEHRLSWGENGQEKQVWFNEYFEPGDWFTVKVEKISLWDCLKGVKISG